MESYLQIKEQYKLLRYKNILILLTLINLSFVISSITLFLPIDFSPDSANYQTLLENPNINTNLVLKYISYLTKNYQYVNFIYSLSMLIIFSFVFYKMSKIPLITYILFLFLGFPNFGLIQIRSGLAIAFFYLSLFFYLKNKKILSLVLILIGTLFHISLIIFFILIFLLTIIPRNFSLILPLIGIILYKINLFQIIINFVLNSFVKFLLPNIFLIKLEGYIQALSWDIPINYIEVFSMSIILEILIFYSFYFIIKFDKYDEVFFKLFGIGLFLWFFFSFIPTFSQRFFNYLLISQFFLIPSIWINFRFKPKIFGFFIMFIFIMLVIKQSISRYIFSDIFNF